MGRTTNKQRRAANDQSARARAAQMRLEQERKARNRRALSIGSAVVAVVVVVGLIIALAAHSSGKVNASTLHQPLPASEEAALASVSSDALAKIGAGSGVVPTGLPQTISGPARTVNGKPDILYIGAEFCPYCAAERWPLVVALNRFGKVSGLQTMHSSPKDTDPNTPTVTFLHSSYDSNYLNFSPVENEDINHKQLVKPTSDEQAAWEKYDYDPQTQGLGYPFIDFGGKAVIVLPSYDPAILKGLTRQQIIADIDNPKSKVGQAIGGTANYMTAAMCLATGNKPASVCTPAIQALEKKLQPFKSASSSGSSSSSG